MAYRQQQQIDAQQQLLVAKEQRLKYLRQQDMSHHQLAAEYERLRRLREKVRLRFGPTRSKMDHFYKPVFLDLQLKL
jgi:hypothetical protein